MDAQGHTHTTAELWPNAEDPEKPGKGMRVFRVGTRPPFRYKKEDAQKIAALLIQRVPAARVHTEPGPEGGPMQLVGSNYVMVVAPKEAHAQLSVVCEEINRTITACTEDEARGIRPPMFGTK